jgi:hypothetical protein
METSEGKGGNWENRRRSKVRRLGVGKRMRSITTACNSTKDLELEFEHVQISIDKSKPLLTVQIKPKHQADVFSSLIDSSTTANFISPKLR